MIIGHAITTEYENQDFCSRLEDIAVSTLPFAILLPQSTSPIHPGRILQPITFIPWVGLGRSQSGRPHQTKRVCDLGRVFS